MVPDMMPTFHLNRRPGIFTERWQRICIGLFLFVILIVQSAWSSGPSHHCPEDSMGADYANLQAILVTGNVSCQGIDDGTAKVIPYGGELPYTYSWSHDPSADSSFVSGLAAGPISVTVTDATGASVVKTAVVKAFEELSLIMAATPESCDPGMDGLVQAAIEGGTPPYSLVWDNGMTGFVIDSLSAGTYTVTATDVNGCFVVDSIEVPLLSGLDFAIALEAVSCLEGEGGTATITILDGIPPYTYEWAGFPTVSGPYIDGLSTGIYTVSVTDSVGCVRAKSFEISAQGGLNLSLAGVAPTCDTCQDGNLEVIVSGGVAPLSYLWNTGETTATIDGLNPGNYCVTVTDNYGCTGEICTLYLPEIPLQAELDLTDETCLGDADGSAMLVLIGGLTPYSIIWSVVGEEGISIDSLAPGNYSVTISDVAGDTIVFDFSIAEGAQLLLEATVDNAICGNNTGSIDVTVEGGTTPYIYVWNNPAIGNVEDPSGLPSGDYAVTVTDQSGCTATLETIVGDDGVLDITGEVTGNLCVNNGEADLSIDVSGGSGIYSTNWSVDQYDGLFNLTNILDGTYSVTVTDNFSGCTNEASFLVETVANPVLIAVVQPVNCGNGSVGAIDLTLTGGSGNYQYDWSVDSLDGLASPTGLNEGNYCVTVLDMDSGCQTDTCVDIITIDSLLFNLAVTDISCGGLVGGNIGAQVNGGSGNYQYDWNNDIYDGQALLSGIPAGLYCVTITDELTACSSSNCEEVNVLDSLTISAQTQALDCNNDEGGYIFVNISGGYGDFSFDWSVDIYDGSDSLFQLPAGDYCVTVTDMVDGCEASRCFTIAEENSLALAATVGNASCQGQNPGFVFISVQNGTGNYVFDWDNDLYDGQDSIFEAGPSTYCVTVTDAESGCMVEECFEVIENEEINLQVQAGPNDCASAVDGSVIIQVSGGTGPFLFDWSGDLYDGQDSLSALVAGNYCVTVIDQYDGCAVDTCFTIAEINSLELEGSIQNASCDGAALGEINLIVSNGTGFYSFDWDDNQYDGLDTLTELQVGTYCVTVTDSLSACVVSACYDIGIDLPIKVNSKITDVNCSEAIPGSIILELDGGTGPFLFDWDDDLYDGQDSLFDLSVGIYCVTITDQSNGCTISNCYEVEGTNDFIIEAVVVNASCDGSLPGSIGIDVIGGSGAFIIDWDNDNYDGLDSLSELPEGVYCVLITDSVTGCTASACYEIGLELPITVIPQIEDVDCNNASLGSIYLELVGGVGPFTFDWDDDQYDGQDSLADVMQGTYCVTITDEENGCSISACYEVNFSSPFEVNAQLTNPNCDGTVTGSILLDVVGGSGHFSFNWDDDQYDGQDSLLDISGGDYCVQITDSLTACFIDTCYSIDDSELLVLSAEIGLVPCIDSTGGSLILIIENGVGPYVIEWDDAQYNGLDTLTNIGVGTYCVNVLDLATGCRSVACFDVGAQEPPQLEAEIVGVQCAEVTGGSIHLIISNGSGNYTIDWDEDQYDGQDSVVNLPVGNYEVTVTDDSTGCEVTGVFSIEQDDFPPVNTLIIAEGCVPDSNGTIDITVIGGSGVFIYQWLPAVSDTSTASGLAAGMYMVTITDSVTGCMDELAIEVPVINTFEIVGQVTDVNCESGNAGSITISINGSNPDAVYTYDWIPDEYDGLTQLDSLPTGWYQITVTDTFGCVQIDSFEVGLDSLLEVEVEVQGDGCAPVADGSIDLTILNGAAPFQFSWSDPVFNGQSSLDSLVAGLYQVTITDANGCFEELDIVVENLDDLALTFIITDNLCFGDSLGEIIVEVNGGTLPYSYHWAHDSTNNTPIAGQLAAGIYSITITDAGGCELIDSFSVEENPEIIITGAVVNTPCSAEMGGSIGIEVNGGVSPYQISWNEGSMGSVLDSIGAGQYEVTVLDAVGCEAKDTFTVGADALTPEVEIITEVIGCGVDFLTLVLYAESQDSLTITAWQWVINGQDTFTIENPEYTVFASSDIEVELTVTAENGCTRTLSTLIPVDLIDITFGNLTICPGDSVALNPNEDSTYFYSWFPGELFDDSHQINPVVSPDSTTNYQVLVTNITGGDTCQIVFVFDVIVANPLIVNLPADTVSCEESITIEGQALNATFFAWFNELGQILTFGQTLTVEPEDSAYYIFSALDINSCFTSDTILIVDGQTDLMLQDTHVLCVGNTIDIQIMNSDSGDMYSVNWEPDSLLQSDSLLSIAYTGIELGNWTLYAEAVNQYGCSWTDSTELFVIDSSSNGDFLSFGQCEELTMTFINANAPFYKLCYGIGDSCSNEVFSTYTYPDTGTYTVYLIKTDSLIGCTADTIAVEIEVFPPPIFDSGLDYYFASCGDSVEVVFQDMSTHVNDSITTWQWVIASNNSGDTILSGNGAEVSVLLDESDTLYITVLTTTAIGCEGLYRDTIAVELIDVLLPDSLFICPGDTVQIDIIAGAADYQYLWSPGEGISDVQAQNPLVYPTETTTYTVEVTDFTPDTCKISREVIVVVYPEVDLMSSGDQIQCADTVVQVTASVSVENVAFSWSENPAMDPVLGQGAVFDAIPGRPGFYYVLATDTVSGCMAMDTIEISNYEVVVDLEGDSLICLYEWLEIAAVNQTQGDGLVLEYDWSSTDPLFSGSVDSVIEISPESSAWYYLTASNPYCTAIDSYFVTVDTLELTVDLFLDRDTLYDGMFAILEATGIGNELSYQWVPRVGLSNPDEGMTQAQPEETTSYTVFVTNEETGCVVERDTIIYVLDFTCGRPNIFLPNAFTPNNDGVNDELYLRGVNVEKMYLAVYNRWGQLIFESAELNRGWDGTLSGKPSPADVYGYFFEVTCGNGETYFERGNVTLIR